MSLPTVQVDPLKFKCPPFSHQLYGVKFLTNKRFAALFDEMGSGKSMQVIATACILYELGLINMVIIVCPAAVRSTWANYDFGEIEKHCWVDYAVTDYSSRQTRLFKPRTDCLNFVVTNYEFLVREQRLNPLLVHAAASRTMVVFDEGSYIKNYKAERTRSCAKLSTRCHRAYLLNGTPVANNPLDLWAQMWVLDPNGHKSRIFENMNFFIFQKHYVQFGGYKNKQIIKFNNIEKIQALVKPHVLRRLKEDCMDLPPKLYSVVEVPMTDTSWKHYKEMRNDMITWLNDEPSIARQAIVKLVRLAQITSGYLGGLPDGSLQVIGNEKLKFLEGWLADRYSEDENMRVVVWCRFREEQRRCADYFASRYKVFRIYGNQPADSRDAALREFSPRTASHRGPVVLFGQPDAGGLGVNLTTSHLVIYLSNDYSLFLRLQSEDRCHRAGQVNAVTYLDVLATGPQGQKTIDHAVYKARLKKQDVANFTVAEWRTILQEEVNDELAAAASF